MDVVRKVVRGCTQCVYSMWCVCDKVRMAFRRGALSARARYGYVCRCGVTDRECTYTGQGRRGCAGMSAYAVYV